MIASDRRLERGALGDVADFERPILHRRFMAINQIAIRHRPRAAPGQRLASMRTDMTGTAGYEDQGIESGVVMPPRFGPATRARP